MSTAFVILFLILFTVLSRIITRRSIEIIKSGDAVKMGELSLLVSISATLLPVIFIFVLIPAVSKLDLGWQALSLTGIAMIFGVYFLVLSFLAGIKALSTTKGKLGALISVGVIAWWVSSFFMR